MYEYAPWATDELNRILAISQNVLPILDIQFGGACNQKCIYCDTPQYQEPSSLDIDSIEKIIATGNIQWIYACGLGEPTALGNMEHFKRILAISKKYGIKVSVFSNILNLDDELISYIKDGTLYVLFKFDSIHDATMMKLYGISPFQAMKLLKIIKLLPGIVSIKDGTTNLGASIVPTSVNYSELNSIIDFCKRFGIFPLLGQLENAGKCTSIFKDLELKEDELLNLRKYVEEVFEVKYQIPVCPATISAIHITNKNKITVDERTGLSCGWFWMEDPRMVELGDIRELSADEITAKILSYRKAKFSDVIALEKNLSAQPFGGCGGDTKSLLQKYISIAKY